MNAVNFSKNAEIFGDEISDDEFSGLANTTEILRGGISDDKTSEDEISALCPQSDFRMCEQFQ